MTDPAFKVGEVNFFDAPSEVEGAPYWVDLWASVNGYRIGIQIKPKSYRSASVPMFTGKAMSSQRKGNDQFSTDFGGKVFICVPVAGEIDSKDMALILVEQERLQALGPGPHAPVT